MLEWNKKTFYIDGEVESEDRDRFKAKMEELDHGIELTFNDIKIVVRSTDIIPLNDGTFKKAKDLLLEDDVSDSWILENTSK